MKSLRLKRFRVVPGREYGTPKEVWGFRTTPQRGSLVHMARRFLSANAETLGLEGVLHQLKRPRTIESLGARHVIFRQELRGVRIFRAYVTVHADRRGRIYLAKNRARPQELAKGDDDFTLGKKAAQKAARRSVVRNAKRFRILRTERIWFPLGQKLRPAYRVRIERERPRQEWIVHVDGATGRVLRRWDNLAAATGAAYVFDPNPVIALRSWRRLWDDDAAKPLEAPEKVYKRVTLRDLVDGGQVEGPRVSTRLTKHRVRCPDGRFLFRASGRGFQTKPGSANKRGFAEVMAYYHVDRAIRYLESLGYRGSRRIFREPVPVNARGTREDNSYYSPEHRSLEFGSGGVDDAEDAEVILHELGHAIQDAICPDFGRSNEAAAMGEAFGDYFAASYFYTKKPAKYRSCFGTWDGIAYEGDPPCVRRLDEDMTYEAFEDEVDLEHENAPIWSGALWSIRRACGHTVADRIILDSHFQLDGFTTFARGARAIIDADRNLYSGRHVARLKKIFQQRGIGPV